MCLCSGQGFDLDQGIQGKCTLKGRPFAASSALNLQIFRRCLSLVRDFLVLDNLTLIETAEAGSLDSRDMDEHVFSAALRLNKSVTFLSIEPLHRTARHFRAPLLALNNNVAGP